MVRSLGEMLDTPGEYQAWIQHFSVAFSVIHAVDRLGLLGALDGEGTTAGEIARARGLPESDVARLLAFLASEGALAIDEHGLVSATERTRAMQATAQHRIARMTLATGFAYPEAAGTGVTAYEHRYGLPVFEHLKANPETAQMFAQVMRETTEANEAFIFEHHAFRPFALAVDVGGNQGSLLLRLLAQHPEARGVLFDLPETVRQAEAAVAAAGMAHRVERVGGSFFEAVPSGGDLYLLKQILHDWSDDECRAILARVREAMAPGARLAVVERLIPDGFRPHNAYQVDVIMLLWTTGRERTQAEFTALLADTGFAFDRVTENPDGMSVVEALAV